MSIPLHRRRWLRSTAAGLVGLSASGWLPALADGVAASGQRRRHCILLWMSGGPSQTDTFDMKPDHANGGEFKEIQTAAPGIRFSEHLPALSRHADKMALVRGLSTKEGDHGRGTYLMRTGYQPMAALQYPTIGSSLSMRLAAEDAAIPNYVSVSPYRAFNQAAYGPGFLGPKYAPLTVGATDLLGAANVNAADYADLKVDDLRPAAGVKDGQFRQRLEVWRSLEEQFLKERRTASPIAHKTVYEAAVRLMDSEVAKAFDLSDEKDDTRSAYGRGRFGQGCLMARRLVERGVPFVEVSLGSFAGGSLGWDTHTNNFATVKSLSQELDKGWATLMTELDQRGLLEDTTILWIGEFGRTPAINGSGGRDHFPAAWTCVFGGGGITGGQAYGKTNASGAAVEDGKVGVENVLATLCSALGVNPEEENISDIGRPVRLADGDPISEILG